MNKISTRLIAIATLAATVLSAGAQPRNKLNAPMRATQTNPVNGFVAQPNLGNPDRFNFMTKGNATVATLKPQPVLAEDEQTYKVSFNLDFIPEEFDQIWITAVSRDQKAKLWETTFWADEEDPDLTAELPAGTYDFVAFFQTGFFSNHGSYFVIHENVKVEADMTEAIAASEATNHIQFNVDLPNGEPMKLYVSNEYEDEEGNWVEDIIEEGNVTFLSSTTALRCTFVEPFPVLGYINAWSTGNSETSDVFEWINLWTSPASSDYLFFQTRCTIGDTSDKVYGAFMATDSSDPQVLQVTASDYNSYTESIARTPVEDYAGNNSMGFYADPPYIAPSYPCLMNGYNDITEGLSSFTNGLKDPSYTLYGAVISKISGNTKVDLDMLYQAGFIEYIYWDETYYFANAYRLTPPQVNITSEGPVYINNYSGFAYIMQDNPLQGNPAYSFPQSHKKVEIGGTAPINCLAFYNYNSGGLYSGAGTNYRGLVGEFRECDTYDWDVQIMRNGEETTLENIKRGKYEVLITDNNVRVDGIEGTNETYATFDPDRNDWTPPTVTMMQMRNPQGDVTNKFAKASDINLVLSATDLEMDTETWDFVMSAPESVTVEYSPFEADDWSPLAVAEKPEYNDDAFGTFFTADMADVTRMSRNGWFDLRITVADKAGNLQQQVVSPVFRIDALTGIDEVATAAEATIVAVYDIDGRLLPAPQRGCNLVRYSDGTTRKLLIP